jgi:hypothetical protein
MKSVYLLLCLSIFVPSCRNNEPQPAPAPVTETVQNPIVPNQDSIRDDSIKWAIRQEALADSIRFEKRERESMKKLEASSSKASFRFHCDTFQIEMGNLVNHVEKHALIEVFGPPGSGELGFYKILFYQDGAWQLLEKIEVGIEMSGQIFKDMNGDGHKDFVVEGYGMAGTGEKYFNDVYLWNSHGRKFDYIEGLGTNPYFHSKQGIVTCYYNPLGVWTAEKYRLNWNKLELLEEIDINIAGLAEGKCLRKIYRYRKGEKYLFKQDETCNFPPEYKPYRELVKK